MRLGLGLSLVASVYGVGLRSVCACIFAAVTITPKDSPAAFKRVPCRDRAAGLLSLGRTAKWEACKDSAHKGYVSWQAKLK
jgi:hypothetical protein